MTQHHISRKIQEIIKTVFTLSVYLSTTATLTLRVYDVTILCCDVQVI